MHHCSTRAMAGLTLAEALRTVGLSLEAQGVRQASLAVTASGITVSGFGDFGQRVYPWTLIAIRSTSYHENRGEAARDSPWPTLPDLTRWPVLLRTVGQLLDADGPRECGVAAALSDEPGELPWQVDVTMAGETYLRTEDVQVYALRLQPRVPPPEPDEIPGGPPGDPR
jgi:hypothetical protein